MELYNLSPAAGSTKEAFRKGRGHGSGNGKTDSVNTIFLRSSGTPQALRIV